MRLRRRVPVLLAVVVVAAAVFAAVQLRRRAPPEPARLLPGADGFFYVNLKWLRTLKAIGQLPPVPHDPEYEQFIQATGFQFERDLAQGRKLERVPGEQIGRLTDESFPGAGAALNAGRHIDGIPGDSVSGVMVGADVASDHRAGVDADVQTQRLGLHDRLGGADEALRAGLWRAIAGAAGSLWDVVHDRRLGPPVEVLSGVLADDCAALLTSFFERRRSE